MGYCSRDEIEKILAQSLTTASTSPALQSVPADLTSIGRRLNLNLITEDSSNYYIRLADSHINAALSQQYVTPIKENCDLEMSLLISIDEYNDDVELDQAVLLVAGDMLYFTDGSVSEHAEVSDVDGMTVSLREPLLNLFDSSNTRVMRLKFPDPIPFISARLAAATIYDKYAKAQAEPSKTEFGDAIRAEAIAELNNIREGRTILHGVPRRGMRFANANLLDRFPVKGPIDQDSSRSDQRK